MADAAGGPSRLLRSYIDLVEDPSRRTWLHKQVAAFMSRLDRG